MSDTTQTTPADVAPAAPATPNGTSEPVHLPDDHPLVRTLAAMKDEVKTLKSKAARLDEIEAANKTAEEKAAERAAAAEQRAAEAEAKVVRRELAIEHGLSKDDAALLDGITDEDAMRRLAQRLAAAESDKKKPGNHSPREGNTPKAGAEDETRSFARELFSRATAD